MGANSFPRGLYGITPDWPDTARMLAAIEQAHAGGMRVLQWRRKSSTAAQQLEQAGAVSRLCRRLGLMLIINDDWQLAATLGADGVHLGRDDGPVGDARKALGPDKIIGCSCYDDTSLAARMLEQGVDYIAFGAMYPSAIKPDAVRATTQHISTGRRLADAISPRPAVVAIGGITPDNAAAVIQAGADSIAVISALFDAPDIRAAAESCSALFV